MLLTRGWKLARLGVMIVAMVLTMTFICQAATVTGFTVRKVESREQVEIHLNSNANLNYRVKSINSPRQSLVIEMPSASIAEKAGKTLPINMGLVESAKLSQYQPGVARLTVDVLQPVKYDIQAAPDNKGFVLVVSTQTVAAQAPKAAPKTVTAVPETTQTGVAGMPASTPKQVVVTPVKQQVASGSAPYKHVNVQQQRTTAAQTQAQAQARKRTESVKLVSLDFVNADLIYVLKLLASELNVNLVTDPSVTGSVTMSLKDVSAQTALNIIVRMQGYQMKKLGNILFIGTEATVAAMTPDVIAYQPTGNVRVVAFNLEHINAQDAATAVKNAYPLVQVQPGPAGRSIVVTANPALVTEIGALVQGIDVEVPELPPVAMERIEVVRLKYANCKDMAVVVKNLLGADAPSAIEMDERLNAIVLRGYDEQIQVARRQVEELDIPLQQVMLNVKVVDLSETGSKNLGITWQVGARDGTQPIEWYEVPQNFSTFVPPGGTAPQFNPYNYTPVEAGPIPFGFFVRNPFVFSSALNLQITQGEARVLASPRVATLSGHAATLHIGDKYPIVYYDPRAGQYQVIYVEIGILLTVKPVVSADGYITTEIDTLVSDLRELINNQYPRTTERSAKLTIRVKDNNTIVIGGMVNESTRKTTVKVPLLGDIPVLGVLFRNTTAEASKSEVVIMITPKIITQ
jgi:type IV pilus assembly protein PilQ